MCRKRCARVWQRKSGELWPTNNKVGDVSLNQPKSTFSEDHISAICMVLRPQIFTRAREWPRLASVAPSGVTCLEGGMLIWVQLLGSHPKIWQGKKRPKFGAISDNFRLWSRISPERREISKIGEVSDQQQPLRVGNKNLVNFGPLTKHYRRAC